MPPRAPDPLENGEGASDAPPSLVALDPRDPSHVAAAAALHAELLPESFVPRLGEPFLRAFYYPKLGASGLIEGALALAAGHAVGWIVWTDRPDDFLGAGARRHLPALALATLRAVAARPGRLAVIAKVLREMRGRERRPAARALEILTLGVVADWRGRRSGDPPRTLASRLVDHAVARARERGIARVQVVTRRDNARAVALYRAHGFEIDDPDRPEQSCRLAREA